MATQIEKAVTETALPRSAFISRESAEWGFAWDALRARYGGDFSDYNQESGEAWQYMGTWEQLALSGRKHWVHTFRHRDHPKTKRRENVAIEATATFHLDNKT